MSVPIGTKNWLNRHQHVLKVVSQHKVLLAESAGCVQIWLAHESNTRSNVIEKIGLILWLV